MSVGELRRRPVTRRHVLTQVGGIAVPILLSTVVSLVTPLVNAAIVGHGRPGDLYVLALVLPVVLLLNSVNESLRVSSVAFSSQASGDGNLRAFRSRIRGLLIIGVTINLSIALVFLVGHRQFMTLYAVPEIHQGTVFRFVQLSILTGTLLGVSMLLMSSLYGLRQVRAVTVVTVIGLGGNVGINAALVPWAGIWSLPIATTVKRRRRDHLGGAAAVGPRRPAVELDPGRVHRHRRQADEGADTAARLEDPAGLETQRLRGGPHALHQPRVGVVGVQG